MATIGAELRAKMADAMLSGDRLPAYAWPGGYQLYYYAQDMGVLCPDCANAFNPETDNEEQLKAVACDVNYEDAELFCEHCNKRIESAYAEAD